MFDESDYERASKLAQNEIDAALSRHRAQQAARGAGRETCLECGEPIPAARRLAVAAELCVDCQAIQERQANMTGGAMSWTLNWTALRFSLDLLMLVGVVMVGIYSWWVARNQATKSAIDTVGERVYSVEERMTRVERDIRNLPTPSDLYELNQRIATVHGDLREIKGALQGLSRAVDLMNEHLISRGGRD